MAFNMDDKRCRRLRRLSTVPRWAAMHTNRRQTVDAHSFQVAVLALWLADRHATLYTESAKGRLAIFAIAHDEAEAISSDLPSPFKAHLNGVVDQFESDRKLGKYEDDVTLAMRNVIKVADILEALLFVREEEMYGNTTLGPVRDDLMAKLDKSLEGFQWGLNHERLTARQLELEVVTIFSPLTHPVLEA